MTRQELEHVIRAAATVANTTELIVVGSQAILGSYPDAPAEMCASADVDIYPKLNPERSDLIDGSLGELSPFHDTFGYYAQGVGPETVVAPRGWQSRLVVVDSPPGVGLCLDPHDLFIAKYVAGRHKDREYLRSAIRHGLAQRETLTARLRETPLDDERRDQITAQIARDFAGESP